MAETPVAEDEPEAAKPDAEAPVAESMSDEPPAAEPDVEPEAIDASIEADAVAPGEQGPGDSEGEPPSSPDEPEQQES